MINLQLELLDQEKLIKNNNLKEITNPVPFTKYGVPSPDGLLSNEIFGIDKVQRSETYAYIDLYDWFLHPHIYKIWSKMDSKIVSCVHGTKNFSLDNSGYLIEDENGETGIKFLKDNIDKINIKKTNSDKRDVNIKLIKDNKDLIFMKKLIVLPAYYRDVDTSKGYVGIGEENRLYNQLIIAVKSLREADDYGLPMSNSTKGRIQDLIVEIYKWYTTGTAISSGAALSSKKGLIRRAVLSKTVDYSTRLVLSAPNLTAENIEDIPVTIDNCMIPMASVSVNLFPFVSFWIRRFFENEFSPGTKLEYKGKNGKIQYLTPKDPLIEFSDVRITKEIDRFIHGYSNRFAPVIVPTEEGINARLKFKGLISTDLVNRAPEDSSLVKLDRGLTWCDLIFMACVEMSRNKYCIITRYPIDTIYNHYVTGFGVSSTKDTEPIYYNTTMYKMYPKIREEDISKDTSNKFVDTLNMSNCVIGSIGGDRMLSPLHSNM